MPHVVLVPLTGMRVREEELLALGMALPGLMPRARAIGQLPALGLLTLAGHNPDHWTCSYLETPKVDDAAIEQTLARKPDLVTISALSASAYRLGDALRRAGVRTVLGGLHATACPDEARQHVDAVVGGEGEPVWRTLLEDATNGGFAQVISRVVMIGNKKLSTIRQDLRKAMEEEGKDPIRCLKKRIVARRARKKSTGRSSAPPDLVSILFALLPRASPALLHATTDFYHFQCTPVR